MHGEKATAIEGSRRRTPIEQAFADIPHRAKQLLPYTLDDLRWGPLLITLIESDVRAFSVNLTDLYNFSIHEFTSATEPLERYASKLAESYLRQSGLNMGEGSDFDKIVSRIRRCVFLAITEEDSLLSLYSQEMPKNGDPAEKEAAFISLIKSRLNWATGVYYRPIDQSPIGHSTLSTTLIDKLTLSCVQGFFYDVLGARSSDVTERSFASAVLYVEIACLLGLFDENHPHYIANILLAREALQYDLSAVSQITRNALEGPFQKESPRLHQLKDHWSAAFATRLARHNTLEGNQQPSWISSSTLPADQRFVPNRVTEPYFTRTDPIRRSPTAMSTLQSAAQSQLESGYAQAKRHESEELHLLFQLYFQQSEKNQLNDTGNEEEKEFIQYVIKTIQRSNISQDILPLLDKTRDSISQGDIVTVDHKIKELLALLDTTKRIIPYLYSEQENAPSPVERVALILYALLSKAHLNKSDIQLCDLYQSSLHPVLKLHTDNKELAKAQEIPEERYDGLRFTHPETVGLAQERLYGLSPEDGLTSPFHEEVMKRLSDLRMLYEELLPLMKYGSSEINRDRMEKLSGYFVMIAILVAGLTAVNILIDDTQHAMLNPLYSLAVTMSAVFLQIRTRQTHIIPELKYYTSRIRNTGLPKSINDMKYVETLRASFRGLTKKKMMRRKKLMATIAIAAFLLQLAVPMQGKVKDLLKGLGNTINKTLVNAAEYRRPTELSLFEIYRTEYQKVTELHSADGENVADGIMGFQIDAMIDSNWNEVEDTAMAPAPHEYAAEVDPNMYILLPGQTGMNVLGPSNRYSPPEGQRVVRVISDSQQSVSIDAYGQLHFEQTPNKLFVIVERDSIIESGIGYTVYESQGLVSPSRPWENWQNHYDRALELNKRLQALPDQKLAALHAYLLEEYRQINIEMENKTEEEKKLRFDQFIKDVTSLLSLHIREHRVYSDDHPPTSSNEEFSDLMYFSQLMESGTDCDITALAFQDFLASFNITSYVLSGNNLQIYDGQGFWGIGHAKNIIVTASGVVLRSDSTPTILAPNEDLRSQQLPTPPTREQQKETELAEEAASSTLKLLAAVTLTFVGVKNGRRLYLGRKRKRFTKKIDVTPDAALEFHAALPLDLFASAPPEWQKIFHSTPTDAVVDALSIVEIILGYQMFQSKNKQNIPSLTSVIQKYVTAVEHHVVWRGAANNHKEVCVKLLMLLNDKSNRTEKVVGRVFATKNFSDMITLSLKIIQDNIERASRGSSKDSSQKSDHTLSHVYNLLSLFIQSS